LKYTSLEITLDLMFPKKCNKIHLENWNVIVNKEKHLFNEYERSIIKNKKIKFFLWSSLQKFQAAIFCICEFFWEEATQFFSVFVLLFKLIKVFKQISQWKNRFSFCNFTLIFHETANNEILFANQTTIYWLIGRKQFQIQHCFQNHI